jgi:hypothetical protein
MALKTTLAAAFAAVTMMLVPMSAAEAKTKVVIGIGGPVYGGIGYYHGCGKNKWRCHNYRRHAYIGITPRIPVYAGGYYAPRHAGKLSCSAARNMVDHSGFNHVKARDCKGKVYSFSASRKGHRYLVRVNAHTGRIVGTGRI